MSCAVLVAAVAVMCGCTSTKPKSSGAGPSTTAEAPVTAARLTPSRPASPFRPTVEPAGYQLAVAGRGSYVTELSSDSVGTVEPMIVLADPRLSEPLAGDVYTVSAVRYDSLEAKFAQASRGYVGRSRPRRVRGRSALFTPPGLRRDGIRVPIDLVVDFGNGWAVRVWGTKRAREADVIRVAALASLNRDHMPMVAHPPSGLTTVSRVAADEVAATTQDKITRPDLPIPGPPTGYSAGYFDPHPVNGQDTSVVFLSLRGSASDLLAVKLVREAQGDSSERATVVGRSAWLITHEYDPTTISRSIVFVGPVGNLFLVTATGNRARIPDFAALERMAAGVRSATSEQWQALVRRAP